MSRLKPYFYGYIRHVLHDTISTQTNFLGQSAHEFKNILKICAACGLKQIHTVTYFCFQRILSKPWCVLRFFTWCQPGSHGQLYSYWKRFYVTQCTKIMWTFWRSHKPMTKVLCNVHWPSTRLVRVQQDLTNMSGTATSIIFFFGLPLGWVVFQSSLC